MQAAKTHNIQTNSKAEQTHTTRQTDGWKRTEAVALILTILTNAELTLNERTKDK